jgi:transcriptional regulator with XRE-family HTH domain
MEMLYQMILVLRNTKRLWYLPAMKTFGETLRDLRTAQDLGLRETAVKVGISPAYMSRIERGREGAPRAEIIKELARILGADPDVLFRLSSSTDPEVTDYLRERPHVMDLVRYLIHNDFTDDEVGEILTRARLERS